VIIRPETLVHWHRAGFRHYWRWKSRSPGGRPQIETDLRALIRRMSVENPLWGAPRIHGGLLKLGSCHGSASCSALGNCVMKIAASRRVVSFLPFGSGIGSLIPRPSPSSE
jgi:hypothetical protein